MLLRAAVLTAAAITATSHGVSTQSEPVHEAAVKVVTSVPLVYPQIAQSARFEGIVVVAVTLDEQGSVTEANALSGVPILTEAAVANVRRWTFGPSPQRRAVLVYDFQISPACVDAQTPPRFTVRRTLASVYGCQQTVQPQR
jgi:TonB family protein